MNLKIFLVTDPTSIYWDLPRPSHTVDECLGTLALPVAAEFGTTGPPWSRMRFCS